MGRGARNGGAKATMGAGGSSAIRRPEGEIGSLYDSGQVTSLDEVSAGTTARVSARVRDADDRADDAAIERIARRLLKPGGDAEAARDRASTVYAGLCRQLSSGEMADQALAQFAALVGEPASALRERVSRA